MKKLKKIKKGETVCSFSEVETVAKVSRMLPFATKDRELGSHSITGKKQEAVELSDTY